MSLVLQSSGGGSVTISEPVTASNVTATLPAGTGTIAVQGASTNIVSSSAVSASGTSVDFTSIPSWVKRITVNFYGVSTNGTSPVIIQIGATSFVTSGYSSHASAVDGSSAGSSASGAGFLTEPSPTFAAALRWGQNVITTLGSNLWVFTTMQGISGSAQARTHFGGGAAPTLSGALDRVRITTVNGTDAFDGGTINILYEQDK